jgi:hypothetical protein
LFRCDKTFFCTDIAPAAQALMLKTCNRAKVMASSLGLFWLVPAISIRMAKSQDYRDGRDKPWDKAGHDRVTAARFAPVTKTSPERPDHYPRMPAGFGFDFPEPT